MPLAMVNVSPRFYSESFRRLLDDLPAIIASVLTCENPAGELIAKDIAVWLRTSDNQFDRGSKDLQVLVLANDYPERRKNLEERQKNLKKMICGYLPSDIHGWVWILLAPASFGEF